MSKRSRIITLSVLSILIVICIVLGVTYSFMQADIDSSSVTEVSLSSCAKITLEDGGDAILLENSYPVSRNVGLNTDPYTFTVTSDCESYVGFNMYLATLDTNTLSDNTIHYVITKHESKEALAEGILSEASNALSEFTSDDQNQINIGINGTFGTIYKLYNESIPLQGSVTYDLYLFIDESVTNDTMNQEFRAGIAIKSYDRKPTLSEYVVHDVYTGIDGDNGLYYHDGIGTYINSDLETGDYSYRYAGADPNNYVCFGTSERICSDDNLYRIIGVFNNQIKLIKSISYGSFAWDADNINTWDLKNKPDIYTILNIMYYNSLESNWQRLISENDWQIGGISTSNGYLYNAYTSFNYEVGINNAGIIQNMKIGLMYVSDYYYGAIPDYWNYPGYSEEGDDYRITAGNNWLNSDLWEWTISKTNNYTEYALAIGTLGRVGVNTVNTAIDIRPTFYLNSDVEYISGTGTESDPYRIQ